MFTVTDTKDIDFNTYWEMKPQYDWTIDQLQTQDIKRDNEIYIRGSKDKYGEDHINYGYNLEIYSLFNKNELFMLDIGCGGGGFIKQCIQDGHKAIGIDLGIAYQRLKSFAWKEIPDNLFVRDIGQPLTIYYNNKSTLFDFIHSWDVFEHIKPKDTEPAIKNIVKHCYNGTKIILKIANWRGHAHRNVRSRQEYATLFSKYNLIEVPKFCNTLLREKESAHMFYLEYHE